MNTSLIPIKGISLATESKLAAEGIKDIPELLEKAATPDARLALAVKLKVSEKYVYSWVKQGELLRVEGMTADASDLLVKIGIRDVEDLSLINTEMAIPLMKSVSDNVSPNIKYFPSKENLTGWKNRAIIMKPAIEHDPDEPAPLVVLSITERIVTEPVAPAAPLLTEEYFYDMGDVISSVGRGIAEAQHALDVSAITTQQQINEDDDLRVWGLTAQWYTIPEATVNLKMNYQFTKERSEEGEMSAVRKARLLVSPINAKYTNTFKVNETLQSELNLKFLPIPPPTRWTEQLAVPDFTGMTLAEATELINEIGMKLGDVTMEDWVSKDDGIVESQSPAYGTRVWLTEKAHIRLGAPVKEPEDELVPDKGPAPKLDIEPDPEPDLIPIFDLEPKINPEPEPSGEEDG